MTAYFPMRHETVAVFRVVPGPERSALYPWEWLLPVSNRAGTGWERRRAEQDRSGSREGHFRQAEEPAGRAEGKINVQDDLWLVWEAVGAG